MPPALLPSPSDPGRAPLPRRVSGFLLVLLVHILLLILVFRSGPPQPVLPRPELKTFQVTSYTEAETTPKPARHARRAAAVTAPRPPAPPVAPVAPPHAPVPPLHMLLLSKDEFAAADIANMPSHHDDRAPAGGGDSAGSDSASSEGAGEGPGGERLYNAEWYVEPTHAELAYYMPSRPQSGWGMIACKTVPNFRVEDCQELGESPAGSGLSRTLRQAAWQFRVLPPRIGGRKMVGAWVRIRFDFTLTEAKGSP